MIKITIEFYNSLFGLIHNWNVFYMLEKLDIKVHQAFADRKIYLAKDEFGNKATGKTPEEAILYLKLRRGKYQSSEH